MRNKQGMVKFARVASKTVGAGFWIVAAASLLSSGSLAQPAPPSAATNTADTASLQAQLGQLRQQVAELSRIIQSHGGAATDAMAQGAAMPGSPGTSSGNMSMGPSDGQSTSTRGTMGGMPMGGAGSAGGMSGMNAGGMGAMEMDKMEMGMGGMKPSPSPSMGGPGGPTGMESMMGMMPAMQGMRLPSALPGFPGASHLYHIGATGFFLDHPQHLTLTTEQQTALNKIKEQAVLAKDTSDRQAAGAEQELWQLTSSDQPDAAKIEAKVREIEKQRADARLAFIRSVGAAAQVLTDEQRSILTGQAPSPSQQSGAAAHQPNP